MQQHQTPFQGIWVAMVTPFRNNELDLAAAQNMAKRLQRQGVSGLFVCGTTGEAPTLNPGEQLRLLATVTEATGPGFPVAFGIGGNNTTDVIDLVRTFNDHELAGLVLTTPYYNRPSQEGMRQHFEAIARVTPHPIIIYNIPYRTGVNLEPGTARALCANPQFVAIKESNGGNLNQLADYIQDTPLKVLCGDDDLIFTAACLGAHGAISAAAHIRPDLFVRMLSHINGGDIVSARELAYRLRPLIRVLFSEPNPSVVKAALAMQGEIHDGLRLPMTTASAVTRAALEKILEDVMAIS